mmetsp:Transcript_11958/g.30658  ORF Transcript_11958/g.30658 Transcript_11958/m.30658 type:complete len:251 (-) Transcript_11958:95-847(-)
MPRRPRRRDSSETSAAHARKLYSSAVSVAATALDRGYATRASLTPVALKRYTSLRASLSLPVQHGQTTKHACAATHALSTRSEAVPHACNASPMSNGSEKALKSPSKKRTFVSPAAAALALAMSNERFLSSTMVTVQCGISAARGRPSGPQPPAKSTKWHDGFESNSTLLFFSCQPSASSVAIAIRLSSCQHLRSTRVTGSAPPAAFPAGWTSACNSCHGTADAACLPSSPRTRGWAKDDGGGTCSLEMR